MNATPLRATDPRNLGSYRLLARLGEGGMGTVLLAEAPDGRRVALKVIRPEFSDSDEFRARFRREVEQARRVPSFCTAEVLDADPDHATPFLVVEYVDGPSLDEIVTAHGPLTGGRLQGVAIGVATALAAIHGAGVVHRDLKPTNVLFALGGPKVIDFGIAKAVTAGSNLTLPGQMLGTVAYMAPERFDDRPTGAPADIFAWGVVIAFAATGTTPFAAGEPFATAHRILHDDPRLDGVPAPLREVVANALLKDPASRPTAHDLLDALLPAARRELRRPASGPATARHRADPDDDPEPDADPNDDAGPDDNPGPGDDPGPAPTPFPTPRPAPTPFSAPRPAPTPFPTPRPAPTPNRLPAPPPTPSPAPRPAPTPDRSPAPTPSTTPNRTPPPAPSTTPDRSPAPTPPAPPHRPDPAAGTPALPIPLDRPASRRSLALVAVLALTAGFAAMPVAGRVGLVALITGPGPRAYVEDPAPGDVARPTSSRASRNGERAGCPGAEPLTLMRQPPQRLVCGTGTAAGHLTDLAVTARIRLADRNGCAAVWVHYVADRGYRIAVCPDRVDLHIDFGGAAYPLASAPVPASADWQRLRVSVRGAVVEARLNDDRVLREQLTVPTFTGGRVMAGMVPAGDTPASARAEVAFAGLSVRGL